MPEEPSPSRSALLWALGTALLAGLALRGVEAFHKSLWLDELHTLAITRQPTIAQVLELLTADTHAPLYFLTIHAAASADPEILRLWSIVPGMLALLPILALARQARFSTPALWVTAFAFAALPYQIQYGAELRPYAWLQLCCATMAWAAFATSGPVWLRLLVFALAVHVGLWVQYFACFAVLACGAARLFVRWPTTEARRPVPVLALIAAGTIAVAAFVPHLAATRGWLFSEPERLVTNPFTHKTNIPRYATHLPIVLQSFPRSLAPTLNALGGWQGTLATGALSGLAALLLAGLVRALSQRIRGPRASAPPVLPMALVAALTGWLMVQAAAIWFLDRSDTLQYLVVVAWVWPLLLGASIDALGTGRWLRLAAPLSALALLAAGVAHATGAPREDTRRAVAMVRAEATRRGALVTAALSQPKYFPPLTVYDVLAPDLGAVAPADVPPVGTPDGDRPVVVLARRMGPFERYSSHFWREVPTQRRVVELIRVDAALQIYVLEPVP